MVDSESSSLGCSSQGLKTVGVCDGQYLDIN